MTYALITEKMEPEQEQVFKQNLGDPFDHELTERERVFYEARRRERQNRLQGQGQDNLLGRIGGKGRGVAR